MTDQEKEEIKQHYREIVGEEVFEQSWELLEDEGYTESSLPYMAPETVHRVCGDKLMLHWKKAVWPKYPYVGESVRENGNPS